jgi:hypothetical protein
MSCNCKGRHHSGACKRRRGISSKESKGSKGDVKAQKRRYYEKYRERINLQQREYDARKKKRLAAMSPKDRADFLLRKPVSKREYRRKLKAAVIAHYGICPCGESRPEVLEIDHINDGGQDHRREIAPKHGRVYMPAWLKKNNYPPGYQILCRLCHDKKGSFIPSDFTIEQMKAYARESGRPRYQYLLDPE